MDLIVNAIFILAVLTIPFKVVVEMARFFGARDALKSRKNKNDYRREEFEEEDSKQFVSTQSSAADFELYELVEQINNLKKRVKWLTVLVVILLIVVILF